MSKVYNAKDVVISFNGEVMKGFAEDSFIAITRSPEEITKLQKQLGDMIIDKQPMELKLRCKANL